MSVVLYGWGFFKEKSRARPDSFNFITYRSGPAPKQQRPFYEESFITPDGADGKKPIQVHVASLAELANGMLAAVWYGGVYEGSGDTRIFLSTREPGKERWSPPSPIMGRERASRQLGRYIKKVGNPLIFARENRLLLLFVTVSVGGWSGSSLNIAVSHDRGISWTPARRLTLSPFLNVSTLCRNNPLPLSNGAFAVPIYHECLGSFSEMLWLTPKNREGDVFTYCKNRMTRGKAYIQPTVAALGTGKAIVVYRNFDDNRTMKVAFSTDFGQTWSPPQATNLPNPNSGLNALPLSDNRILLAFNDSQINRENLSLATSSSSVSIDDSSGGFGKTDVFKWNRIAKIEDHQGEEFSYPYLLRTQDNRIHLVYTWRRQRIKLVSFNEAWLNSKAASSAVAPEEAP
ncbi:MAG: exo-alpha-sialidase [bacterium]|nr:exo-alpha-sialidase [bacterium]